MRLIDVPASRPGASARRHRRMAALAASALLAAACMIAWPVSAAPPFAAAAATAAPAVRTAPVAASASPIAVRTLEGVREYRLPNGLQLLLVPDDTKPVVAVQLTVRSGALEDPVGASGAMHLLEHLMFRTRAGQGRASIVQHGILANATTTHDQTTFMASFAADAGVQQWYLSWLAGAFADGAIEQAQVVAELGAIRNEMQGANGSALGIATDAALSALYAGQGYGRAPIGRIADIESLDATRLGALRARHYRLDNATLVIAGAFDVDETLRSVARDFGALPRADAPPPAPAAPAPLREPATVRTLVLQRAGAGPLVVAVMPAPAARDADAPAARLLAYALTRESSGTLTRRLVDTGLASRVLGQVRAKAAGGTFVFAVQPAAGQEPAAVAEALRAALRDPGDLTAVQVEQARHGWMAEWRRRFNDPERLAEDLSEAVGRGDWRLSLADYARIRGLGQEDLQRVATDWFRTPLVATLVPADAAAVPAARPAAGTLVLPEQAPGQSATSGIAGTRRPLPGKAAELRPRVMTLDGGRLALSVVRRPQRGGAVVARLAIPILPAASSQEQTRAAGLLAAMLGTFRAVPGGAPAFQLELDRIETGVTAGFFRQELTIDVQTSADRFDDAMARVRTLLEGDHFEQGLLDAERRKWRGRLDRAAQDPPARLEELLSRHTNHYASTDVRYVPTIEEEMASLDRVQLADIAQARAALLPLRAGRMAIVGDIDPAVAAAAIQRHLRPLLATDGSAAPALVDDLRQAPEPATLVWRAAGGDNAFLTWTAFLPVREGEHDALALALANRMFGQQGSGRLWRRLREREGLSYGAWSDIDWNGSAPGAWWRASASFAAADRGRVEQALDEELARVEHEGFAADELAAAKAGYLQEQRRLAVQPVRLLGRQLQALRTGTWSGGASLEQTIAGLSLDDVNTAWRRHVRKDRLVRAIAGNVAQEAPASSTR